MLGMKGVKGLGGENIGAEKSVNSCIFLEEKYRNLLIFDTFFEIPIISESLYLSNGQKMPKSPKTILNLVSSCIFLALYLWVRNVQELTYFHFCQFLATFLKIIEFLYVS